MSLTLKLATTSGLSWATIRRYAKSKLLERDEDDNDRPVYMHHARCSGGCDFGCNGDKGFQIAADVETEECWLAD